VKVGAAIIYHLHTRNEARLEGSDWEKIFAGAIGADWRPSNVGLDDVRLDNCCWGAKTVKSAHPLAQKTVRLISGRNSLDYSYNFSDPRAIEPNVIGPLILQIWNDRVSSVRQRFAHVRTIVLMKSIDLLENTIFEIETLRFEPELYTWKWNVRNNIEGFDQDGVHRFTWQPSGSQFTVVEDVPDDSISFRIRKTEPLSQIAILEALGFEDDWVTILDRPD
jgi:hypothetical protein